MDYHSIHGHDVASFDVPSSHRMPTVSASAVLDDLKDDSTAYISTGLSDLDKALVGGVASESQEAHITGGVKRGQVTEIWGPPGSGKTALGIQLTAHALSKGDGVVWVDCFQSLSPSRVRDVVGSVLREATPVSEKLVHYSCLTLPHLIALISRPSPRTVPEKTSLFVISSLATLVNSALPKPQDGKKARQSKGPSAFAKRQQALQAIMKFLQTLASTKKCAVVILSPCATKMRSDRVASLTPAITAGVWDQLVSTRVVLFRDWDWQSGKPCNALLAGLQKVDGKTSQDLLGQISAFQVSSTGLTSVVYDAGQRRSTGIAIISQPKRKLGHTDFEVPDSEDDEDYGWADEDEAHLPPPPSQWQGSEDILLGQAVGRHEDHSDWDEANEEEDGEDTDRKVGSRTPLSGSSPRGSSNEELGTRGSSRRRDT